MKKRYNTQSYNSAELNDLFVVPQGSIRDSNNSPPTKRIAVLGSIALLFLIVIMGRSMYLGMAEGIYRTRAEGNRTRLSIQYASRGIFFDRHGAQLVQNVPTTDVVIWHQQLPEDKETLISTLREIFPDVPVDQFRTQLFTIEVKTSKPIPLISNITDEERVAILSRAQELPGIGVESRAVREYADNELLSHVLGYTGRISPEDLKNKPDYYPTENIGKTGLERQYEEVLRGVHGSKQVEVNALGKPVSDLGIKEAVPGASIRLHLDMEMQRILTKILQEHTNEFESTKAAAIALDPADGAVRAMVSIPTYDHTALSRGGISKDTLTVFTDTNMPLLNRVIQGQYPPGSLFKLPVSVGIIEEDVARPNDTVVSTGGISIGQWHFPDWKHGGHGITGLKKAIAESVNTYFYIFGGGYEGREGLGVRRIATWAEKLGFASKTGIDMPNESEGFLPSKQWKQDTYGEPWYIGDTYHLSIGQGSVTATPLQIAVATATIANGGTLFSPKMADALVRPDGTIIEKIPHDIGTRVMSNDTAQIVREGMRQAVEYGSASRLSLLSTLTAGKTGTAQTGKDDTTHAWFSSFAPYNNPELAIVILVEEGGGGEDVAVPIAHEFYQWYFNEEPIDTSEE